MHGSVSRGGGGGMGDNNREHFQQNINHKH